MDTGTKNLKVIRRREVEARTGLSRSTIYAKMKPTRIRPQDFDESFPKPIKIGVRAVGWIESEIDSWLAGRARVNRES